MMVRPIRLALFASALALVAASAGGAAAMPVRPGATGQAGVRAPQRPLPRRATATPIQHIVFIVQENRSFNNLFLNYPGALTQDYGYDTSGNKITLHPERIDER